MTNVLWTIESRYATVCCYEEDGKRWVRKVLVPHINLGQSAEELNRISMVFRKLLKDRNVPLAEPYTFDEDDGHAVQLSSFVGDDLQKVAGAGGFNRAVFERLIGLLAGILSDSSELVGIDARISNFCLSENGDIVYVDTFPPLLFFEGRYIVHFPNPTDPKIVELERFRKFNRLGILRRLRFSLLEQSVGISDDEIISTVRGCISSALATEVAEYFKTFPDRMPLESFLAQMSLSDPDGIREVALCMASSLGDRRPWFLNEIFELSSNFCPRPLSQEQRLTCIRDLLMLGR